jgi:Ca2+-dependent lipid-binding protein
MTRMVIQIMSVVKVFLLIMVQKVKTSVQKKNPNPVWNEVLQLSVTSPTKPVHLVSLQFQLLQQSLLSRNIWMHNFKIWCSYPVAYGAVASREKKRVLFGK